MVLCGDENGQDHDEFPLVVPMLIILWYARSINWKLVLFYNYTKLLYWAKLDFGIHFSHSLINGNARLFIEVCQICMRSGRETETLKMHTKKQQYKMNKVRHYTQNN